MENLNFSVDVSGKTFRLPSHDKLWEQYYDNQYSVLDIPKRTVYQEVYLNNKDYLNALALEYFGSKISFDKFFKMIDKTALSLKEYGVNRGDFVSICSAGIPETSYVFYALSKIGAIANMIAPYFDKNDLIERIGDCESDILISMDTFYPEIKDAIKRSRIKHVIVLPTLNSSILGLIKRPMSLEKNSNELYWNQFIKDGKYQKIEAAVPYEKEMPLTMVYSSGTTGASKGILLSNDSFQNSVHAYLQSGVHIERGKKFYQIIPPWYSTGLSTSIHLPLSCGSAVFMDPRFERNIFVKNIIKYKPNYSVAPTSMYEGFLDNNLVKNKDLSYFCYPFEGGEPLRKETSEQIEKVFKEHNSAAKLLVGYGQCECGATITTETSKTDHSKGSVGIPLPGIVIGIFDDNYNELSYNERGQILAKTPSSMLEYYKNDKETDKYFYIDNNGDKWNCTGDIGFIDVDGQLHVQGRASDYTMIKGNKIYNFDVEALLMELSEIKICDVLEKNTDDNEKTIVCHLVFDDQFKNQIKNNDDLINELVKIQEEIFEKTNDENMVPYIFKVRDSFPYAKSGKRDIKKLKSEEDGFILLEKYSNKSRTRKLL